MITSQEMTEMVQGLTRESLAKAINDLKRTRIVQEMLSGIEVPALELVAKSELWLVFKAWIATGQPTALSCVIDEATAVQQSLDKGGTFYVSRRHMFDFIKRISEMDFSQRNRRIFHTMLVDIQQEAETIVDLINFKDGDNLINPDRNEPTPEES